MVQTPETIQTSQKFWRQNKTTEQLHIRNKHFSSSWRWSRQNPKSCWGSPDNIPKKMNREIPKDIKKSEQNANKSFGILPAHQSCQDALFSFAPSRATFSSHDWKHSCKNGYYPSSYLPSFIISSIQPWILNTETHFWCYHMSRFFCFEQYEWECNMIIQGRIIALKLSF